MKKIFLLYIAILTFTSCQKTPPSRTELINEETYVFKNEGTYLYADVPEKITYKKPLNPANCNLGTSQQTEKWKLTGNSDYIEVTIQIPADGVLPGSMNSRSFGFFNYPSGGPPTLNFIPLTIQSGLNNTVRVYSATWRFSLNAQEDLLNEIIQNGYSNDNSPFKRIISNKDLGNQWRIMVPATVPTSNVNATIRYHLHMGPFETCP